jgi:hypothetical protein
MRMPCLANRQKALQGCNSAAACACYAHIPEHKPNNQQTDSQLLLLLLP